MSRNYPSYRVRPDKNLAVVTLTDSLTGKRRDYYLGEYDSPESRERYHQLIAAWDRSNGQLPPPVMTDAAEDTEVLLFRLGGEFWTEAVAGVTGFYDCWRCVSDSATASLVQALH